MPTAAVQRPWSFADAMNRLREQRRSRVAEVAPPRFERERPEARSAPPANDVDRLVLMLKEQRGERRRAVQLHAEAVRGASGVAGSKE